MAAKKSFKLKIGGEQTDLYFKPPTHEEVMLIDMEFRRIYSLAIRNDVITQAEAIKQYMKSGAWNKEDDNEVADTMLKLTLLENVIKDEKKDVKERREAALKAANLRSDLLQKMNVRTGLFDHTAESMAEQQKLHKFIILCTYREEDDEKFFDNRDDYQTFINNNGDSASALYKEAYFYDYELPEDISESWAEVQFLKQDLENQTKEPEKKKRKKRIKKAKKE